MEKSQCSNIEKIFVPPLVGHASASERERENFHSRLHRARSSQIEYGNLFRKLNIIIDQLKEKFLDSNTTYILEKMDNEYEETISYSTESSINLATSMTESTSESISNKRPKRKHSQIDCNSLEYDIEMENVPNAYPKILVNANVVILGPNGTQLEMEHFEQISWDTAAAATRSLLGYVFSSDTLATHTLTGKPSPAFRGNRERPPKMQLDTYKTADIIYCVRAKCGSSDREIRAVITTKCADTAKKYKRRLLKKHNKFN